jgi:hypothetical protein
MLFFFFWQWCTKRCRHTFFLDLVKLMTKRGVETKYVRSWQRKGARLIWMKYMGERDTSKCGDCHCIHILRVSADVYTSQRGLVEQSFSPRFVFLPMFSLALFLFRSCIYNWWAKAQILNIRRDDSWKKASAKEKRREEKNETSEQPSNIILFVQ